MFNSQFYQRLIKYFNSPKRYIVNIEIQVKDKFTFIDVEVISNSKIGLGKKAKEIIKKDLKIIPQGSKCLGRIKQFNEF